jgi:ankyrin repeat protein
VNTKPFIGQAHLKLQSLVTSAATNNGFCKTVTTRFGSEVKVVTVRKIFMKLKTWMLAMTLALTATARAATNDLTGLLQQGLFEEEANRNLDAAISDYQSLASDFDKDRQLAATAIFRLGECYRKLGKTNEAVVQYQRIVKEFSDQPTLVNLSRQNLAGLNITPTPATGVTDDSAAAVASLQAQLDQIEKAPRGLQRILVQQNLPNPVLNTLMQELDLAQQNLITLKSGYTSDNPKIKNAQELMDDLNSKIDAQVDGAVSGLREKLSTAQMQLRGAAQRGPAISEPARELQLVKKLQAMPLSEVRQIAPTVLTDATLINLIYQYNQTELDIVRLRTDHGEEHPDVKKMRAIQAALEDKIKERLDGLSRALSLELGVSATASGGGIATQESATTDDEQKEIRDIQAMIQNSPDLINAQNGAGGRTPLTAAAEKGQLVVAKYLLDHGADVNGWSHNHGEVPLTAAAGNGHKAMVELLLARGADVSGGGLNPLYVAVQRGYVAVAEVLLANKADVNLRSGTDISGARPIHSAVLSGKTDLIQLLINHGADVNVTDAQGRTALEFAATQNDTNAAKLLLASKAAIETRDKDGNTPLYEAVDKGNAAMVSLLLDSGATVDDANNKNTTPLLLAVSRGRVDVTRILLEHKADPNRSGGIQIPSQNYLGNWPPILLAVDRDENDILKLLLDAGGNPDSGSPIFSAILNKNNVEAVRLLLDHRANPNRPDGDGNPPLSMVLKGAKDKRIVSLLLDKGADANARDKDGMTPLTRTSDPEIGHWLIEHKADVNARTAEGDTPIMSTGDTNYLEFLLDAGAKTDLQNTNGDTALHFAALNARASFVAILLRHNANPNIQNFAGYTPLDIARTGMSGSIPQSMETPNSRPNMFIPFRNGIYTREEEKQIAELLVKAGGLANLPKRDRIEVRRASESGTTYTKGSHDWNRFSLLELVAGNYGLLSRNTSGEWSIEESWGSSLWNSYLRFPDFKNLVIYRRVDNSTKQTAINVNLEEILNTGDCSRDVGLLWGDIVEIPEADHPVDQYWEGLSDLQVASVIKCVSRQVTVRIKGESTTLKLAPELDALMSPSRPNGRWKLVRPSFMLRSVLDNSKLIRVSSDLSHVKVTRHDPITKKTVEWIVDCTDPNQADLWLRDGDVIEVPEK